VAAALLGFVTSFLVLRGADLTKLMVTLGVALVLGEVANQASWLTGGADGLQGIVMGPVLGLFEFDIFGTTAYAYSLAVTFVLFVVARRIVVSPFGLSLRSIRDNPLRRGPSASREPAPRRGLHVSAAYAGVAGALLAQTTQFVSLDVLAFHRSADVLLVLVIGGVGYLYGGLIGAVVFKVLQDVLAGITPQYWQFWIGLILVVLVLAGRERVLPARARGRASAAAPPARIGRARRGGLSGARLETGPRERVRRPLATTTCLLPRNRPRTPDRPQRRRQKTTFINLLPGCSPPSRRPDLLEARHHGSAPEAGVQRGLARTFQITSSSPPDAARTWARVLERLGGGRDWWRVIGSKRAIVDEIVAIAERFRLMDVLDERTSNLPYGKQRLLEIAVAIACQPRVLLLDEPAAGVPEAERHELLATIAALPRDVSVLLIEHDMDVVFSFADRISVLVNGALFTEGSVGRSRPILASAPVYLGGERR
jgi:ABC-type branched-subunit amino acid transport system ATPase component/branched-subunit amino acid ABC-type transport system permease component